jgi:chromosome segregation ATPase
MPDRRQRLREAAGRVKDSVAGTISAARDAITNDDDQFGDDLGPGRGTMDQFEARRERARQQGLQSGAQEARQAALEEVRRSFEEARQDQLEAQFKLRAQDDLLDEQRKADQAQAQLARVEARREALDQQREERIDTIRERERERFERRLEAQQRQPRQPAGLFGMEGGLGQPANQPPREQPPAANPLFGEVVVEARGPDARREQQPPALFGGDFF